MGDDGIPIKKKVRKLNLKELPRHIAEMVIELERIVHKMNLTAINDDFD